jgi:hypothetical protein
VPVMRLVACLEHVVQFADEVLRDEANTPSGSVRGAAD